MTASTGKRRTAASIIAHIEAERDRLRAELDASQSKASNLLSEFQAVERVLALIEKTNGEESE